MNEPAAVIETSLTHKMHRLATSLLAYASVRSSVPLSGLAELRDFLVNTLHHHHESEDNILWPMITKAAPEIIGPLADLSNEHVQLDSALDKLATLPIQHDEDRAALWGAAVEVRDLIHRHLEHEEPLLFPALRMHVSPQAWAEFSRQVIATSPPEGAHLLIGLFDQVGTAEEVELILSGLPEPAKALVPTMRQHARAVLRVLQASG